MNNQIGNIRQLVPEHALSAEEKAVSLNKMCQNALVSMTQLNQLAEKNADSPKAVKTARKIQDKYGERLSALCEMDFSSVAEENLAVYYSEVSNIISGIRKAKDLF